MNRYNDALYAQMGACNPVALAGALHRHMTDMTKHGADHPTIQKDPALRLIAHQLAHLLDVSSVMDMDDYEACVEVCKGMADNYVLKAWRKR